MKIPRFVLIIGGMKCGTTSLFNYLAEHPAVCACSLKEPNFFSDNRSWERGIEWYQSLWEDWHPARHKIALEASVSYTKNHDAIPKITERIASLDADFQFIFIARNPIERIESHYTHGSVDGWPIAKKPLAEYVDPYLIEVSKYARQLDKFVARFPRKLLLIVDFQDIKYKRNETMEAIERFLGLDVITNPQIFNSVHNRSVGKTKFNAAGRLLSKVDRSLSWTPAPLKKLVRPLFGKTVQGNYKLSQSQRLMVSEALKDDLLRLHDQYGVDIQQWSVGF